MNEPIRLLIVDDQALMRDGLETILSRQEGISVVGSAADGQEALRLAQDLLPDVILMDVRMPVLDGVSAAREIHRRLPDIRILMLTTFDDEEYIIGALRAGAVGYVLKNIPAEALAEAVHMARRGIVQLDPSAAAKIVGRLGAPAPNRPHDPELRRRIDQLTEREIEVMRLVATGASNREIADQLVISEGTVKTHISHILGQLDLRDRTQLAIFVYQYGLLPPTL